MNEIDNLKHPGLLLGHLIEASSGNLFAGKFSSKQFLLDYQRRN